MSPSIQADIKQPDFSAGMSRDAAPPLISLAGVYDLVNALLDEDGSAYRRGGSVYKSSAGLGKAGLTWIDDIYLQPGQRTVFANSTDFGVLGSDDKAVVNLGGAGLAAPKQAAVLEDILFIGGGALYAGSRKAAPYSTGTVTVTNGSKTVTGSGTTWNTLVDAGMLFQIGSERVYVVASIDSTTQITLRDAYQGTTGSGKSYALRPLYTVEASDPYESWDYVCVCANRLVLGTGNAIKSTEIKNPHTFTNSLGTTNEHTLPEGVQIVGLTTVGQTVLAFTTAGIWTVEGLALDETDANGNPQHRTQQLSSDVVLAGAPGLAGSGQEVIVPATDGIFLMDGVSTPQRISKPIDRLYRGRIAAGYGFGRAVVYRNHYFLPILGDAGIRDLLVCRLDRPITDRRQRIFPWTRLSGDAGETTAFAVRSSTSAREPLLLGAQGREPSRVVDCSGFFEPTSENENDADGTTHELDLITRDYETGAGTENVVRELVLRYELVGSSNPVLKLYYSDGSLIAGFAKWDEVKWDEFKWSAEESAASFTSLDCEAPVSDERHIHKCRVNKKFRYARFRVRSSGPAAYCALRSIELRIRPSRAVRR